MLARFGLEGIASPRTNEPGDNMALGFVQKLGTQPLASRVLEISGEEIANEELAVLAAFAEDQLHDHFRGVANSTVARVPFPLPLTAANG